MGDLIETGDKRNKTQYAQQSKDYAVGTLYFRKIILQQQQFVERYAELSEPIRIP